MKVFDKTLTWQQILAASIVSGDDLGWHINSINKVSAVYPMRINPYYLSLIQPGGPLWKQVVPDIAELDNDPLYHSDPLCEEEQTPVPNLIHRYPDRVVFLISDQCAVYCRFCMRRRKLGQKTDLSIEKGLDYIRANQNIRDVILSGGDPLILSDAVLEDIIRQVRAIKHVEIIRIHTRIPCTLPQRITNALVQLLKKFQPLFINIHFNHHDEITPEAVKACTMLADAGFPLGSQTVLLKGVNDDPQTMKKLMHKLMLVRIKPYYLHHPDLVCGTAHFRPALTKGYEIIRALQGHTSGLCVPHYMIDLPGGGGKVPCLPDFILTETTKSLKIKNFADKGYQYPC